MEEVIYSAQEYINDLKRCTSYKDYNVVYDRVKKILRSFWKLLCTNRNDVVNFDNDILAQDILTISVFDFYEEFKLNECLLRGYPDRILFDYELTKDKKSGNIQPEMIINNFESFTKHLSVFSSNIFANMDWSNVVLTGGSVLACLLNIPELNQKSKRKIRKYYLNSKYSDSDLDFYIYGLNKDDALKRLESLVDYFRNEIPYDVQIVRSVWSITIVSQYPFRHIQIIARLHANISELLSLIDIDCCQMAYDGKKLYCSFDCYRSLVTRTNFIDLDRRSLTTDMRYFKYSKRGFQVIVPDLDYSRIDYSIIFKPYKLLSGCSKLILLSYIPDNRVRSKLKDKMAINLGKESSPRRTLINDVTSDYSAVSFPWGKSMTINSVIYRLRNQVDKLNNPKRVQLRGGYHYHPCVIGSSFKKAIAFPCEDCPKPTIDDDDIQYMVSDKFQFMLPYGEEGSRSAFHKFDPSTFYKDTYHIGRITNNEDFTNIINAFNKRYFDYLGRDIWECAMIKKLYNHIPIMLEKKIPISTNYNGLNLLQQAVLLNDPKLVEIFLDYNSKQLEILKNNPSYDKYIEKIHTLLLHWPAHLISKPNMISFNKSIGLYRLDIAQLTILLGNFDILKLLLSHGCEITHLYWRSNYPYCRVSVFLLCGFLYKYSEAKGRDMIKFLMEMNIPFNYESKRTNILFSLINYNLLDFTTYILNEYPDTQKYLNDIFPDSNKTPLLYSLTNRKWGFTRLFLTYKPKVVFTEEEILKLHDAEEYNSYRSKSYDALRIAINNDTPTEIIESLIEMGCEVKPHHYSSYSSVLKYDKQGPPIFDKEPKLELIANLNFKEFMSNYLDHKHPQGEISEFHYDEDKLKLIELFKRYYQKPEEEDSPKLENVHTTSKHFTINHSTAPDNYNPIELFEAVCDGNVDKINEITKREGDDIIYIQSKWDELSIIGLALLTKQFSLLSHLIDIGINQYRIYSKDELADFLIDSDEEEGGDEKSIQSFVYSVPLSSLFSSVEIPTTMFPELMNKEDSKSTNVGSVSKSFWESLLFFDQLQMIYDILNLLLKYYNKYKSDVTSVYSEIFDLFFKIGDEEMIRNLYAIHHDLFISNLNSKRSHLSIHSKLFDFYFNHLYDMVVNDLTDSNLDSQPNDETNTNTDKLTLFRDSKSYFDISSCANGFHERVPGEDYLLLLQFMEQNNCQTLLTNQTILSYFQNGISRDDDALVLYLLEKYGFKSVELSFGTLEIQRYVYKLLLKGDNKKVLQKYLNDDDMVYYLLLNLPYVAVVYIDDINWEMFHNKCYNYHTTYILHILPEWFKIYRGDLDILVKKIISLFKYQSNYENIRGYTVVETCRLYYVESLLTVNANVKQYTSVNYLGRIDRELCTDSPRVELKDEYIYNYFIFITNQMNEENKKNNSDDEE